MAIFGKNGVIWKQEVAFAKKSGNNVLEILKNQMKNLKK